MENPRLFYIIAIALVGMFLLQTWNKEVARKKMEEQNKGKTAVQNSIKPKDTVVNATKPKATTEPGGKNQVDSSPTPKGKATGVLQKPGQGSPNKSTERIRVVTDVFDLYLDTAGADIREVHLLKYFVSSKNKTPKRIMTDDRRGYYRPETSFKMNTGSADGPGADAVYRLATNAFRLQKDERLNREIKTLRMDSAQGKGKPLEVSFVWEKNGVKVTKTYLFKPGQYDIKVTFKVENNSDKPWVGVLKRVLKRGDFTDLHQSQFLPTFVGAAIYTDQGRYEKIKFEEIQSKELLRRKDLDSQTKAWVAMLEQFFVGAWLPGERKTWIYSEYDSVNNYYGIGFMTESWVTIAPKASDRFVSTLYVGPKIQKNLEKLAEGLELTVDYGWLTFLSKPLFWLLDKIHSLVGNWGVAIILLTILIKLIFYKLSETSYRSMAKMRKLHPRMQALKERHADNRQAYHMAIQELFRKEKVNPLGGCFPILVQIPVFIALYYVLLESVEMRQAPFMLWIQDLSVADPYFVLPILMGATMFLQHKLNPPQLDPVQQKVMMALPIVFTVFFMFFPAGLVLYWFVNNLLSIVQQWFITKRITGETNLFHSPGQ